MNKTIPVLMVLVAALLLALGSAQVTSADRGSPVTKGTTTICDQRFNSMDIGHKGYLSIRDLEESYYGQTTPRAYSKSISKFGRMDVNGDGKVTSGEYCSWKSQR